MQNHIVIDHINLYTATHLALKHKGSRVTALFSPKSKLKEKFLINFLSFFNIKYNLDKLKFSNLEVDPYQEILVETNQVVSDLMLVYGFESHSNIMKCFNYKLRNILFNLLWRPTVIFRYVKKYNQVDGIYISSNARSIFLKHYLSLQADINLKKIVFFYKSSAKINDNSYLIKTDFSKKTKFLAFLFLIPLKFKNSYRDINSLFFSHDKKTIKLWLNGLRVGNYVNFKFEIAWPNGSIGHSSEALKFRSIYWRDIKSYLFHLKDGLIKFYPFISSVSFNIFSILLRYWVSLFLIKFFYLNHNIRIVYSNYDSDFTQLALAVASDNSKIVSFAAIWSLGNFPDARVPTFHKFVDRFFIWGDWHSNILSSSKDQSLGYVISGYIGDIDFTIMQDSAALLRSKYKKNYLNIIALYDGSVFDDFFFNNEIANNLLTAIMKIAEINNSLVILKSKFNSNRYSKVLHQYSKNLIVDYNKGSLIPALAADVVIGVENSTPVILAALMNKRVINFNYANTVWDDWELNYASDITMVGSFESLQKQLIIKLSQEDKPYSNTKITPFLDGDSQKRMAGYMNDVSDKMYKGKMNALQDADSKYIYKYGLDKIIING